MATKLAIGVDGADTGEKALSFAKEHAKRLDACEMLVIFVIEWSPYTFQTPEENAKRHKRREDELKLATERVIEPAVASLREEGFSASGFVRHGDVAETLNTVATENGASQIIIGRSSDGGFSKRLFGSTAQKLVMFAGMPVTVVN